MEIPKWLRSYLCPENLAEMEEAVKTAELKTSGEIVPVIVRRSSTISHVPVILFLASIIITLLFELTGYTNLYLAGTLEKSIAALFFIILLPRFLGRLTFIQRQLTSPADRELQVHQRAEIEFYKAGIQSTKDRTGILIFVSMMENRVTVLADKGIADKLPEDTWKHVIDLVLEGKKNKHLAAGLKKGILHCGELLEKEFPILADDTNEVPNKVIIKE